jgi:hypothetical protein
MFATEALWALSPVRAAAFFNPAIEIFTVDVPVETCPPVPPQPKVAAIMRAMIMSAIGLFISFTFHTSFGIVAALFHAVHLSSKERFNA